MTTKHTVNGYEVEIECKSNGRFQATHNGKRWGGSFKTIDACLAMLADDTRAIAK
jgi:hypothetical protein